MSECPRADFETHVTTCTCTYSLKLEELAELEECLVLLLYIMTSRGAGQSAVQNGDCCERAEGEWPKISQSEQKYEKVES